MEKKHETNGLLVFLNLGEKEIYEYAKDEGASDRGDNDLADSHRHTADTGDEKQILV